MRDLLQPSSSSKHYDEVVLRNDSIDSPIAAVNIEQLTNFHWIVQYEIDCWE
jgi:hypothetical protein